MSIYKALTVISVYINISIHAVDNYKTELNTIRYIIDDTYLTCSLQLKIATINIKGIVFYE